MSIGSNIKRLRRENNITQEHLAEYLGITSRAISQWECDRTSRNITLIPALCHMFNIYSDELLEINIHKSNEKIKRYLEKSNDLGNQGKRSRVHAFCTLFSNKTSYIAISRYFISTFYSNDFKRCFYYTFETNSSIYS